MRESDQRKKDTVQAKNDAETLGYSVEKQLTDLKEKMSTADADALKKNLEDLSAYMTVEDVDLDELKKKTQELQEKSWKVTQEAYQTSSSEETDLSHGVAPSDFAPTNFQLTSSVQFHVKQN